MRRLVKGVGMAAISAVLLMTGLSVGHSGFSYVAYAEDSDFVIENGVLTGYTGDGGDVVIPDGVTIIDNDAFSGCTSMTSITIPDGVLSLGMRSFENCSGLVAINIPSSVDYINCSAFNGCSNVASITVDSGNSVYDSRDNCNAIIETSTDTLVVGSKNTVIPESVTNIGLSAFKNCRNLTSIEIPDGVTHIGESAFYGCSSLTNIKIPKGLTIIGEYTFYGCSCMETVQIPESVTEIQTCAFYGCTSLTSIVFSESLTFICDSAFSGCTGLTSVIIPYGVDTNLQVGNQAFYGCNSVTTISIPHSVAGIGDEAFDACDNLKDIYYGSTEAEWKKLGYEFSDSCTIHFNDTGFEIENGKLVEYTGNDQNVTIPEEVTSIGCGAFHDCEEMVEIELPDGLISIGDSAFMRCGNLKSITIPDTVISIGEGAFWECSSLEEVTIPSSVTHIGAVAFAGTPWLWGEEVKEENIPYFVINHILIQVTTGETFTKMIIPADVTCVAGRAFAMELDDNCYLTSVYVPATVTTLDAGAFDQCSALTDIYYEGSKEDWNKFNYSFDYAITVHYNHVHNSNGVLAGRAATYGTTGLTKGYYCTDCGEVTKERTIIAKKELAGTTVTSITPTSEFSGAIVSWNSVKGADWYRIYRKQGNGSYKLVRAVVAESTSADFYDMVSGTTYTYAVKAWAEPEFDEEGGNLFGDDGCGNLAKTFTSKSIKYLAPASVSALVNYSKGIQVKWSKITGASGYYIYRKAGSATSWTKVATITSGSTVKWNDTNTTNGLKYQYCIKAYSGSYKGAYKAGKTTYRVTTPSISSVTNSAAGKATVKWNKNTSATGYQISYTTGSTTKTITVSGNTNVSKVISGLTKGKTYTVKVRSYRKVGTTYYYSTWSSAKTVKITK